MTPAHSHDDEEPVFPLTSELIGTIMGVAKPAAHLNAEIRRAIIRVLEGLAAAHYTGCVTFVMDDGCIDVQAVTTKFMYIGPTAK